jgi:hypothetical protein
MKYQVGIYEGIIKPLMRSATKRNGNADNIDIDIMVKTYNANRLDGEPEITRQEMLEQLERKL